MKRKTILIVGGAVIAGLACILCFRALDTLRRIVRWRFPDVAQIGTADLSVWLSDPKRVQPLLLDVRASEEYDVSHLPGAQRVDPDVSAAGVVAALPQDRPIVLYCSAGYRSSALAQKLGAAGRLDVANLDGSIFKWANEGRPLEHDGHSTLEVHPYSALVGRLMLVTPQRRGAE